MFRLLSVSDRLSLSDPGVNDPLVPRGVKSMDSVQVAPAASGFVVEQVPGLDGSSGKS